MPGTEEGLGEDERLAIDALVRFSGSSQDRAEILVNAWKAVFAAEAVSVVAGTERVTSTVTDQRVERIRRLVETIGAEDGDAELPSPYELGVLLRVTVAQAKTALRNWQARYPDKYEDHMLGRAARGVRRVSGSEDSPMWTIEYDDPEVLAYAVDRLRRHGAQKGLVEDRSALSITVPQQTDGADAIAILGIPAS